MVSLPTSASRTSSPIGPREKLSAPDRRAVRFPPAFTFALGAFPGALNDLGTELERSGHDSHSTP